MLVSNPLAEAILCVVHHNRFLEVRVESARIRRCRGQRIEPVDLGQLAQSFIEEIESWKVAAVDTEVPDSIEAKIDSIVVGDASIINTDMVDDAGVSSADTTGGNRE